MAKSQDATSYHYLEWARFQGPLVWSTHKDGKTYFLRARVGPDGMYGELTQPTGKGREVHVIPKEKVIPPTGFFIEGLNLEALSNSIEDRFIDWAEKNLLSPRELIIKRLREAERNGSQV